MQAHPPYEHPPQEQPSQEQPSPPAPAPAGRRKVPKVAAGIGDVAVNDTVRVTAVVTGETAKAVAIGDTTAVDSRHKNWAPPRPARPAAPSTTPTTVP